MNGTRYEKVEENKMPLKFNLIYFTQINSDSKVYVILNRSDIKSILNPFTFDIPKLGLPMALHNILISIQTENNLSWIHYIIATSRRFDFKPK